MQYRSDKNPNEPVAPTTMKGYLCGLKQFFKDEWGYDLPIGDETHKMFGNIDGGLWTTLDNLTRELKAKGMVPKPYNVLSITGVRRLFMSSEWIEGIPRYFQFRLICGLAFLTVMRPNELSKLEINHITRCVI